MSLRVPRDPLWVIIAVVFGFSGPATAEMASPAAREQILAHIDSLHVSRQVAAAEAYIEPRLADARAAADSALIMPLVSKLGRLWVCFGQQKRSEPLLREAVALAAALEDSLSLCDALRWLGGERAGPPEDCGGLPGYEHFLEVLSDPGHEEYGDLKDWIGGDFDPEAFDLGAMEKGLGKAFG